MKRLSRIATLPARKRLHVVVGLCGIVPQYYKTPASSGVSIKVADYCKLHCSVRNRSENSVYRHRCDRDLHQPIVNAN